MTRATGDDRVGLCAHCAHAQRVPAPRAVYWMCRRSQSDARYEKYPRLPMLACPGFEERAVGESMPDDPADADPPACVAFEDAPRLWRNAAPGESSNAA
ncbi:MAG: hypothetical protein ACHQ52_13840 [Candidatus Eisenbacteria bacterium]